MQKKIGIFVDAQNVGASGLDILMERESSRGVVVHRFVFDNWGANKAKMKEAFQKNGFECIQVKKGKNAADFVLTLYIGMVLEKCDVIVICSNDSGFNALGSTLLQHQKEIIVYQSTAQKMNSWSKIAKKIHEWKKSSKKAQKITAIKSTVIQPKTNHGLMHSISKSMSQGKQQMFKWYCRAAKQGHAASQYNLGNMYLNGEGMQPDKREAAKCYRLAAEQGHAGSQNNLGLLYYKGEGVSQDMNNAVKWFRLAAEQEHSIAQFNLGMMYHAGKGVHKDLKEAYIWFSLAKMAGYKKAIIGQENVKPSLSMGEVESAEQEIKRRLTAIDNRKK